MYVLLESGRSSPPPTEGGRYAFSRPVPAFEVNTFDSETSMCTSTSFLAPASLKSIAYSPSDLITFLVTFT